MHIDIKIDDRRQLSLTSGNSPLASIDQVHFTWFYETDKRKLTLVLASLFITAVDMNEPMSIVAPDMFLMDLAVLWLGVITGESPSEIEARFSNFPDLEYNENKISDATWNYLWPSNSRTPTAT